MMSIMTTHTITKAKEARYWAVNLDVWVKKPGPMADVAIRNAAPNSTDMLLVSFLFSLAI